jgi:HSP20 family protein
MFYPVLSSRRFVPAARSFDRSFERFLSDAFYGGVKIEQDDEAWTVTLDVPGVAREQLTLDVDGPVVRIGTVEDAPRKFAAAYELPADIDAEATTAKLEHGVLTLKLAKKKPVVTSRKIEIQ